MAGSARPRGSLGWSWTTLLSPEFLIFTSDVSFKSWDRELASKYNFSS